jgi:hypothetical protein
MSFAPRSATASSSAATKFAAVPPRLLPSRGGGKWGGKWCLNCDKAGHIAADCSKVMNDCEHCGTKAGHLSKFCLVPNDKPLPEKMGKEKRERIEKLRIEYKARKDASTGKAGLLCAQTDDDGIAGIDEDFWASLQRQTASQ